jgi:hypothetical protein
MKLDINKKIISFVGVFFIILSLSFCVSGGKVFAIHYNDSTYPKGSCKNILNPNDKTDIDTLNKNDSIKILFSFVNSFYNNPIINDEFYFEKKLIGFLKDVDPFKKYFNKFSFYYSENNIDACDGIDAIKVYLFNTKEQDASARVKDRSVAISLDLENWLSGEDKRFLDTELRGSLIHELGHVIGNLDDEYPNASSTYSLPMKNTNCSTKANKDFAYKSKKGLLYGSTDIAGCFYRDDDKYFRPSKNSVMKDCLGSVMEIVGFPPNYCFEDKDKEIKEMFEGSKFNVISCGYLIAGIKGKNPTKENAEEYWPECCGLDTAGKNDVPGCFPQRKTIFFPPEKKCEETTFTNISDKSPYDTDMKISSLTDISLLTIDSDNFFKINGKDVSKPDGNGGRKIPAGDLIVIPANTEIKIETGDITCRDYDITLSLEAEYFDLENIFECFGDCE